MAKLPDNFVKPPATSKITADKPAAPKLTRRARKQLEAQAAAHVHDVLIRLSPEQHQALAAACDALAAVGELVTIEDMIKQVIARWMEATRSMHTPDAAPVPPPSQPILTQLRRIAEQPLRRWRELVGGLRRWL